MKTVIRKYLLALIVMPVLAAGVVGVSGTPSYAQEGINLNSGYQSARGDGQSECLIGDCQGGEASLFKTITNILLFIIGAISVIMLIIGGIRYTISQGDSANITAAKNTILYAVIGLVVAILAYAIVNFVITSFTPGS